MDRPKIHSTPAEAVKDEIREWAIVDKQKFLIYRPNDNDLMFGHPAVQAAYADDEYMPYWSNLWPAGRMLAKAVLREPWDAHRQRLGYIDVPLPALEIGCGVGLGGVAALHCGLEVTFSDCDQLAIAYAAKNAKANGFGRFRTEAIDMRSPPADCQYPVIIGSDLMYEPRFVQPLVDFLVKLLAPEGLALIADPDRMSAKPFRSRLYEAGMEVRAEFARVGEPGGERTKGTIYRITRAEPSK